MPDVGVRGATCSRRCSNSDLPRVPPDPGLFVQVRRVRFPPPPPFTASLVLRVLESAPAARTTVQSPLRWSESPEWRRDYMNAEALTPQEIVRLRVQFDEAKAVGKEIRDRTR